jgi:hypothetical protein
MNVHTYLLRSLVADTCRKKILVNYTKYECIFRNFAELNAAQNLAFACDEIRTKMKTIFAITLLIFIVRSVANENNFIYIFFFSFFLENFFYAAI